MSALPAYWKRKGGWTTQDELYWVNHLSARKGFSSQQILANALEAAQRRVRWGDVDRKVVLARLSARLRALTAQEWAS